MDFKKIIYAIFSVIYVPLAVLRVLRFPGGVRRVGRSSIVLCKGAKGFGVAQCIWDARPCHLTLLIKLIHYL